MDDLSPPFRLSSRLISFHLVPSCFNHVAIMFPAWSIMFPSISHHVSTMSPSFPMCPQLGVAHLSAMFSSCQLRVAHLDYGVSSVFIYPSMFPSCLSVGRESHFHYGGRQLGSTQLGTMPRSSHSDEQEWKTQTLLEATRWPAVVADVGLARGSENCMLQQKRTFDVRSNCTGLATWEWSLFVMQQWLGGPCFRPVQACDKAPEVLGGFAPLTWIMIF